MVATVPGAPNTSMTTCFGLNGTISFAAPLGVDVTSLEPKTPFNRYTAKPASATTSTATTSIHRRNNRLPIENRCIREPFDERLRRLRTNQCVSQSQSTITVGMGELPERLDSDRRRRSSYTHLR